MSEKDYSPFLIIYDGLGEPGYKHMRWLFTEYLRISAKNAGEYEKILLDSADRIEALQELAKIDTARDKTPAEPYAYYPAEPPVKE